MNATDIATKAAELIGGDRAEQHGDKFRTFANIATLWNAYLAIRPNPEAPISAVDVGWMMSDLKKARAQGGLLSAEDFVDAVGYVACTGEIAMRETRR